MQFTVFFSTILGLLFLSQIDAGCATSCINSGKAQIDASCGSPSQPACLCQSYPSLMQCFQPCQDPESQTEMNNVQGWINNLCSNAGSNSNGFTPIPNQMNPFGGPTPSMNGPLQTSGGLFAATTSGTNLILSASGTSVIVPFSGKPINTNTPVAGNLYSSFHLGSISVGYKSATHGNNMYGTSSSNSSYSTSPTPSLTLIVLSLFVALIL